MTLITTAGVLQECRTVSQNFRRNRPAISYLDRELKQSDSESSPSIAAVDAARASAHESAREIAR